MKPVYILSASCISPQPTFGADADFLRSESICSTDNNVLYCQEPDFKQFINPVQIRRMSRALKIGFSAAMDCLNQSGILQIDAVIVGTGKGCLVDTESFLHSIKQYHETALNPTHFIHSTYNQLNGMIALNRKINSYNMTYVHRGFSFEHSLLDAALLIEEGEAQHVLAGSFDEMTSEHLAVKGNWGYWKKEKIESRDLLRSDTPGTIAGEGSSFFVLGNEQTNSQQVCIRDIRTLYKPEEADLKKSIESILSQHDLQAADIDLLMCGNNGNVQQQHFDTYLSNAFPESTFLYFKHLCGDYDTASQFACWLSTQILLQQTIPHFLYHPLQTKHFQKDKIRYILLYNNYFEINQSLILLSV
ncbi:MAG: beta-ketoacyl synthase chain length factor [Chitinophagaceae bacterium]|nr:beta-ketoacyl synthase chain length factor [Chitinophagaceae bacterium]